MEADTEGFTLPVWFLHEHHLSRVEKTQLPESPRRRFLHLVTTLSLMHLSDSDSNYMLCGDQNDDPSGLLHLFVLFCFSLYNEGFGL